MSRTCLNTATPSPINNPTIRPPPIFWRILGEEASSGTSAAAIVVARTALVPSSFCGDKSAVAFANSRPTALAISAARVGFGSVAAISRITVSTGTVASTDSASSFGVVRRPSCCITGAKTRGDVATSAYDDICFSAKFDPCARSVAESAGHCNEQPSRGGVLLGHGQGDG